MSNCLLTCPARRGKLHGMTSSSHPKRAHPLRHFVLRTPVTQTALARKVGITESYLSLLLNGLRPMSPLLAQQIMTQLERLERVHAASTAAAKVAEEQALREIDDEGGME